MPTNPSPGSQSSLDDWLRWQEALHPQAIALGLERVRRVAVALGLPASKLRTLTVAGTNGKGSSTVLASEIYRAAGYRVGTYTSPHLLRYNERVAIDGRVVEDADLVRAFAAIEKVRGEVPLTYFEFGTLAALWLFREAAVQVQVLEVGLGGRLDAVNIVDPDAALITNIGLDHVEYLGREREQIGVEKAGILRRARPAVCADPEPPASIARCAAETGARLWQLGCDFRYQVVADAWNWHGPDGGYKKLPPPALAGAAQFRNAAGVVAAITQLQDVLPVPETAIRAGLARLRLAGRFERRQVRGPGGERTVILDVAHNVEAARVLAENLSAIGAGPCKLVVGMLSDKPVAGILEALADHRGSLYVGGLPPPRGLAGAQLLERAGRSGEGAQVFGSVGEAFAKARAESGRGELIVVCGSFLTVAEVARMLGHG